MKKTYKVKIRETKRSQTIKANSELEARVLFCEKNNLLYRHLASKLEVIPNIKNLKTNL